jgi:glycosyltransferase involved in cell wall biosynthesis
MRKKIFILAHSYGMQFLESCNQYTQLFDKNQYEVCVGFLLGADSPAIRKKVEAERIVFFQLPSTALQGLKLKAIQTVYKFCRQEKFEMVVCHRYKPSYIMLIVAQFCQIKAFLFVMHAFGTMSSIPRRVLMALLAKKNMVFAAVSSAARDDMRKDMLLIDKERIITLYNIIDHLLFEEKIFSREEARARLNLPPETFIFGHIGRLVIEKDQANLIKAFHLIK